MSPTISLITPTGARPESFALCEKYISQQTYKGSFQWIVVDDYPREATKCTLGQEYYVGPLEWKPGINTQRYNMDLAFSKVKGDILFIIEDDDFYSPQYIEVFMDYLKHVELLGEACVVYYNVSNRHYRYQQNFQHASLCQTALKKSAFSLLYRAIHSGEMYMDIALWKLRRQVTSILFEGLTLGVGIKGTSSLKKGIGFGHTLGHTEAENVLVDKDFIFLPNLLKSREAAEPYRKFYNEQASRTQS